MFLALDRLWISDKFWKDRKTLGWIFLPFFFFLSLNLKLNCFRSTGAVFWLTDCASLALSPFCVLGFQHKPSAQRHDYRRDPTDQTVPSAVLSAAVLRLLHIQDVLVSVSELQAQLRVRKAGLPLSPLVLWQTFVWFMLPPNLLCSWVWPWTDSDGPASTSEGDDGYVKLSFTPRSFFSCVVDRLLPIIYKWGLILRDCLKKENN